MLIRQNSKILLNKIHKFFQSNLKEFPKIFAKVRKKSESAKMGEKRGAEGDSIHNSQFIIHNWVSEVVR